MIELDPSDPEELAYAISKAVKKSGFSLAEISQQLADRYGVEISVSGLSHLINRGTIRLQRALQILAICGVTEVGIKE